MISTTLWPSREESVLATLLARARETALDLPGSRMQAERDIRQRRRYAGDPWGYFRDILGWELTGQQEEVLELFERETRILVPSANNIGKTFLGAGYGVYRFDAVAALPDEETGAEQQGARILLPGPDHDTVFRTIYAEMLTHAARAEARGHLMPGERSERSVLWYVRPKWDMEVLSPPKRVGQSVAHTASGRHHRNQIAIIEEGQGVGESLWKAAEGMCSSAGNKIISPFNPTEPSGPAYQRARAGSYHVIHLDAFEHPNILHREPVIPGAVDFSVIDQRVRNDCRDRGSLKEARPEPEQGDFVYALPPAGAKEKGPRRDGLLGHRDGTPRVYRPSPAFTAQVRGKWPSTSDRGLFDPGAFDAGVARWLARPEPTTDPDAVGVDPAREGDDDTLAAPRWGESAETLLRAYAEAQEQGEAHVKTLQRDRRAYVGSLSVLPKGKGPDIAIRLDHLFPRSPFNVDDTGVGSSPYDHLERVLKRDATAVSFGAKMLPKLPGEPFCENIRTQLYVRAAMLTARHLVDPPDDHLLREELMAHELEHTTMLAETWDPKRKVFVKMRVPSVALIAKDEVKKRIGRSPDRSDGYVLSLFQPHLPAPADLNADDYRKATIHA